MINEIQEKLDKKVFFGQFIKDFKTISPTEIQSLCPFHDDKVASMSINIESGLWYCHACNEKGNIIDFYKKITGRTASDFCREYGEKAGIKPKKIIKPEIIEEYHALLLKNEAFLKTFIDRRGLSLELIKHFKIGLNSDRYTIPIRDKAGNYVNIRRYKMDAVAGDKMLSYKEGYGKARIFPIENLKNDEILICEGETDCLTAIQNGLPGITVTSGAGTWNDEWNESFRDKKVIICYDIDDAGRSGALRIANKIANVTPHIKIIHLPITEPKNADLTDYFLKHGNTSENFMQLIKETPLFKAEKEHISDDIIKLELTQASHSNFTGKKIQMTVTVAGKDLAPYIIPKHCELTCPADKGKQCNWCGLGMNGGKKEIVFDYTTKEGIQSILDMVQAPEEHKNSVIKRAVGISKCPSCEINIKEYQNIEELKLIPEIDFTTEECEYAMRVGYYIGHGIRPNTTNTMIGITYPHPKTQYATHLIYEAKPAQDNLSNFKMTPELCERLKIFRPDEDTFESVGKKIRLIAKDLTMNVTRIYGREDLIIAMDLVLHTALYFPFIGKVEKKGWGECLILGDSRCGKSDTAERLQRHYKVGDRINAETASIAGLLGGLQQTQKRWTLTWGKAPLNDRRILWIDETSGMQPEMIASLSGIRSEGIAELVKIQTEKTYCRTRFIWMSNPRSNRALDTYSKGILAVPELIGNPEDIARFDFVITAANNEVAIEKINTMIQEKVEHIYTSDLCHSLIIWVWSRKPEQIEWTEGAEQEVLNVANELSRKYHTSIPIVKPAEQRIKVAKLAVAVAARVFSSSDDGEKIIVKPCHVKVVNQFLQYCFEKPSLSYGLYSKIEFGRETLKDEEGIHETLSLQGVKFDEIINGLLSTELLTASDLHDIFGLQDNKEVKNIIGKLVRNNALHRKGIYYIKTPAFNRWLVERMEHKEMFL